jgi:hypothetical protein
MVRFNDKQIEECDELLLWKLYKLFEEDDGESV